MVEDTCLQIVIRTLGYYPSRSDLDIFSSRDNKHTNITSLPKITYKTLQKHIIKVSVV
jgi:hypothetical protein